MGAPSTKLVSTPPPASQYPGIANSFQSMMQGLSGGTQGTMSEMLSTGAPTNIGPAYEAMLAASKRQTDIGRQNLLESFGQMGLRNSSSAESAAVDYESQVAKDFASILSQYTMGAQESAAGRRLGAAQTFMGPFSASGMTTYAPNALVTGPSALSQIAGGASSGMMGIAALMGLL